MDFGLIALILVVGAKVLDYVAPKTKTKVDDTARDLIHKVLPLLPAAKEARAKAEEPVMGKLAPPALPAATKPADLGFKVRDHR